MAYFPNGSSAGDYQERYCDNCVHDVNQDCPVWGLHLTYNYDECNKENSFLDRLIPRCKDKLDNEQCRMFVKK